MCCNEPEKRRPIYLSNCRGDCLGNGILSLGKGLQHQEMVRYRYKHVNTVCMSKLVVCLTYQPALSINPPIGMSKVKIGMAM